MRRRPCKSHLSATPARLPAYLWVSPPPCPLLFWPQSKINPLFPQYFPQCAPFPSWIKWVNEQVLRRMGGPHSIHSPHLFKPSHGLSSEYQQDIFRGSIWDTLWRNKAIHLISLPYCFVSGRFLLGCVPLARHSSPQQSQTQSVGVTWWCWRCWASEHNSKRIKLLNSSAWLIHRLTDRHQPIRDFHTRISVSLCLTLWKLLLYRINNAEKICIFVYVFKARVGEPGKASNSRLHFKYVQPIHPTPSYPPSLQSSRPQNTQTCLPENC